MNNKINKKTNIFKTIMLVLALNTTYILCGGSVVYTMQPLAIEVNASVGVFTPIEQTNETIIVEELSQEQKLEKAMTNLNVAIAQNDEIQLQYEKSVKPKPIKVTTHTENCLWEDCKVETCMTNVDTAFDYNYNNTLALYFDENRSPVYGIGAVRDLNIDRYTFINTIAPFAQSSQKEFGIPASTIIAQAILESGWGKKVIGNNIFGIKDTPSYTGPTVMTGTDEYNSDGSRYSTSDIFRGYNSIGEAVYDYSKNVIVAHPDMYGGVVSTDWMSSVYGLTSYATSPHYFELVISVIQDFDLTRFNKI